MLQVEREAHGGVHGEDVFVGVYQAGQPEFAGGQLVDRDTWFGGQVLDGDDWFCRGVLRCQHAQDDPLPGLTAPQAARTGIASGQPLMRDVDEAPHQPFLVGVGIDTPGMLVGLAVDRCFLGIRLGVENVICRAGSRSCAHGTGLVAGPGGSGLRGHGCRLHYFWLRPGAGRRLYRWGRRWRPGRKRSGPAARRG